MHQEVPNDGLRNFPRYLQRGRQVNPNLGYTADNTGGIVYDGGRFPEQHQGHPRRGVYVPSEEHQRRSALALAATWVEGEERDRLLEQATAPRGNMRRSAKDREIENLRM